MRFLAIIMVLVMLGMCVFGAITTVVQFGAVRMGMADRSWPETQGIIMRWDVVEIPGGSGTSGSSRIFLSCEYRYTVGGVGYTNDRVASCPLTRGDIYQIKDTAKEGAVRSVYYDPANPKNSVLVKGAECFMLAFGVAFFIVPLVILISLGKNQKIILELWKGWAWFSFPKKGIRCVKTECFSCFALFYKTFTAWSLRKAHFHANI